MQKVEIWLSPSMVNLLHANAQLRDPDGELDAGGVLVRVVSMKAKGVSDEAIYINTPIEWRDDIDTEAPDEEDEDA